MTFFTARPFSLSLVCVSFLLINACSTQPKSAKVNQTNPQQVTTIGKTQDNSAENLGIIRSPTDNREYAALVLDNQLEVFLVSDPGIEKSAAAVSVAVGSFQEPKGFGGLAHYLEHMLFLGTKTYPKVGEYSEFISQNGGTQNAYTELDHTNYMVAVNNDAFDHALARFSRFFYEATLDENYADKERNAVHSEWTMKGPNDWVILEQLNGTTLNPQHPISQFNWGNLTSLSDKGDNKLQSALEQMYQTYYSANLMKAVLISHLPIDEMKNLAKKHFAKVPNKHTPRPKVTEPVAKSEHVKKIVRYVPQADMKQLRIEFVMANNAKQFAVKPNGYVNYLLSNEMPGTLASELRNAGLSQAVYSSYDADKYANSGSFTLYIDLTESGLKNRDKVMAAVVTYLQLLRNKGVDPVYFKEIKQSLSNSFRFKEKTNDYNYAMQIAANLQHVPAKYVLSSNYVYEKFAPKAIQQVLDQLTLDNARVFYIDKNQAVDTQMENFAGQYAVQPITKAMQQKWQSLATEFDLNLPRANALMPESFELVTPVHTSQPKQILAEAGVTVHLGHSAQFEQPKGRVILNLNSALAKASARNHVKASLLNRAIGQKLTELQAEAGAAGMGLSVSIGNGLTLTASGFTDKQDLLLSKALKQLVNLQVSQQELANLKASFKSDIQSSKKQILLNQLFPKLTKLISLDEYSDAALLAELTNINATELRQFVNQLMQNNNLRVLAFGNYTETQITALSKKVLAALPANRAITDIYQTAVFKPKSGSVYSWQEDVELADIALIDAYLAPKNDADLAATRILASLIRPALFKQIRTEEQLAYAVNFFGQTLREQMIAGFYIQSPAKGLAEVHQRIALFREKYLTELQQLSAETFSTTKNSVLITLSQPAKNLAEELNQFSTDWSNQNFAFDSKARLIAAVKKTSLQDVIDIYRRLQQGNSFGRVLLQMRGTEFADKDFAEPAGAIKINDIDAFHQKITQ